MRFPRIGFSEIQTWLWASVDTGACVGQLLRPARLIRDKCAREAIRAVMPPYKELTLVYVWGVAQNPQNTNESTKPAKNSSPASYRSLEKIGAMSFFKNLVLLLLTLLAIVTASPLTKWVENLTIGKIISVIVIIIMVITCHICHRQEGGGRHLRKREHGLRSRRVLSRLPVPTLWRWPNHLTTWYGSTWRM